MEEGSFVGNLLNNYYIELYNLLLTAGKRK